MNEKLNKKLAEWARAVTYGTSKVSDEYGYTIRLNKVPYYNGSLDYIRFTESLDACFKWLVPKLDKWNITKPFKTSDYIVANVWLDDKYAFAEAETPALALCLAIEEFINGEAK